MDRDTAIFKAASWWRHEFSLIRPKMEPYHETHLGLVPNPLPRPNKEELEAFQQRIFRYMYVVLNNKDNVSKTFDQEFGWVVGVDVYVSDPADYDLIDSLWKDINPGVRYETHGPLYSGTRVYCVNESWKVKVKNGRGADWNPLL